jgi:hypothetical protein
VAQALLPAAPALMPRLPFSTASRPRNGRRDRPAECEQSTLVVGLPRSPPQRCRRTWMVRRARANRPSTSSWRPMRGISRQHDAIHPLQRDRRDTGAIVVARGGSHVQGIGDSGARSRVAHPHQRRIPDREWHRRDRYATGRRPWIDRPWLDATTLPPATTSKTTCLLHPEAAGAAGHQASIV